MIPRLLRRFRDRIDAWLYAHSTHAPAGHTSLLDELDGVRPMGEVPPLTDAQAARLMADILSPPFADWEETRAEADAELDNPWNPNDEATARAMGVLL
ncbi:hypothetical protein [Cellulomonas sp. KH9]|uniref:hypothetical protein n=1 Tax=Cellulomonas sp. KH9 TaxID=1855324 RepID=UPI0008F0D3DC|nr:hypothetical protein [Cellulomonas sp. KH9]SFK32334.1 hypothetical protein SAMN05216467_2887 [Cellulomonas sp. KH9]